MVPIFFWRLRIDEHGISRKRLWRWPSLAVGGVSGKGKSGGFPWRLLSGRSNGHGTGYSSWRFCADADQKLLLGLIEAVLSPPLPCEVPEEIRVSYGFSPLDDPSPSIEFTSERATVCRDYHWESVLSLRIVRAARQCVAFSRLELSVGPERIQLDKDRYRGACPEAIEAFLRQYVCW